MLSLIGLLASIMVWLGVMHAIAWTWNQQVLAMTSLSIPVDQGDRHMTIRRVVRYHTLGWTIALFIFFALLEIAAFPLWQLLAFASLLALVYGTNAIARGERDWIGKENSEAVVLFGARRDRLWYRLLMVLEWTAYLSAIVFGADLLYKLVT